ncbi:hypothetical protein SAMD00019534_025920 [Acytostelium subglobosum LB1]|uniref:hypothetical protein n=1 Tax=Acytostelium subglobosum LB1 TaxID=1410327 RepID=UPI0006447FD2|nr:hypothetical protein SAMD00019534_025920 [Acytostelium subglobosum LB1]GAM19417.1 hypothetical protein SAMD00019534_025920 [Acytostelium subglobosum LB1]|eukprot:XP_012757344.1 hypothetical protein SAMD00019534_025920 [Acytostelium subglobosum LB1]
MATKRKNEQQNDVLTKVRRQDGENDNDGDAVAEVEFEELNPATLKKLVLTFEKKYNINQEMRIKYADNPERFMTSEIELDDEIKKLQIVATAPELYPLFVKLGVITSLGSLLLHDNVDIVIDIVDLFHELTEQETPNDDQTLALTNSLIENGVVETLVTVLERFDVSESDDQAAIHNTLSVFENLLELKPMETSKLLADKSNMFKYILTAIRSPPAASVPLNVRLYCCEILSIILQTNEESRDKFAQLGGIDSLLVVSAAYKKKAPESLEETEMVENVFSSLCSSLLGNQANKDLFLQSEGIELMLMFIKNKTVFRSSALKVLAFALTRHQGANEMFVERLGLKTLFSAMMKRVKSKHNKNKNKKNKGIYNEMEDDEHIITIVHSLFTNLEKGSARYERLVSKFTENQCEKIDRWFELFDKYSKKLREAEQNLKQEHLENGDDEDDDDEEELFFRRLDAGLFKLQHIDIVIGILFGYNVGGDNTIKERIQQVIKQRNINMDNIIGILKEYEATIETSQLKDQDKERDKQFIESLINTLRSN